MYVVGHCLTTAATGLFSEAEIFGPNVVALMLPDVAQAHHTGYARCFDPLVPTPHGRLIRAHMLEDWFVHFGGSRTAVKRGWAYRRMGTFVAAFEPFFARAARLGLRDNRPPEDSRRGFAHTMMEYVIDTHLVTRGHFSRHFEPVRRHLGGLARRAGPWTAAAIRAALAADDMHSEATDLEQNALCFGTRIAASSTALTWAYRAGVKKFGLRPCAAAVAYVADTIADGLRAISAAELDDVVAATAQFTRTQLLAVGA